ncbi:MAG TPA: tetratricopeptide repeat protein [Ktedonobacterales bacterium]|nr:tetratricopeptide repeat protein [Ktedonobacterales bacterium]
MTDKPAVRTPDRWYRAGKRLLAMRRYADALRFFDQALATMPPNDSASDIASDIWTAIGHCHRELGQFDEALRALARALALNPRHAAAQSMRAEVLGLKGSCHAALEASDLALVLAPNNAEVWSTRGSILHRAGDDDGALAADEQALRLDPHYVPALEGRIDILVKQGRNDEALVACDQLLQLLHELPIRLPAAERARILTSKAHVLYWLERHEEAVTASVEASELDSSRAYTWELMGHALGMMRRYDEALEAEEKALQLDPSVPSVWSAKGRWLLLADRPLEALTAYDEALRLVRQSLNVTLARVARDAAAAGLSAAAQQPPAPEATPTPTPTPDPTEPSKAPVLATAIRGRAHTLAVLYVRGQLPETVSVETEDALQDATIWSDVSELLAMRQQRYHEALLACKEALARSPYDRSLLTLEMSILRHQHSFLGSLKTVWRDMRKARHHAELRKSLGDTRPG